MEKKREINIIFILLLFLSSISFISASLGAKVEINPSGSVYGHELLWKANVTGDFDEQGIAIYADGIVYVNSVTFGNISALNATTGEQIWSYPTNLDWDGFGGPAYYAGIIYDAFGRLYAFNSTTGEIIWNTPVTPSSLNQNVNFNEKYIVAVSYVAHTIQVYNRTNGQYIWHASQGTSIFSEPLLYGDYLIVACNGGGTADLVAYNMSNNGSIIWSTDTSYGFLDSSPILYNNIIYIGDRNLQSYYLNNGSNQRSSAALSTSSVSSTPSTHDGVIFIGTKDDNSKLFAHYVNGTSKWNFSDNGAFGTEDCYNQPAISNGMVFFNTKANNIGNMYAVNETDGSLIWKYPLNEDVYGYTSIAQGNVYVVTDDYHLYAFDFGVGSGNWTLIGHDTNRTGYCSDCLTEWQNIRVNCTSSGNITCTVTNSYDHTVSANITRSGTKYNWYNSSGSLVETDSGNYVVELSSDESQTFTLENTGTLFECVDIVSPGVYNLTNDIFIPLISSACINITTSNVTLDCQGNKIISNLSYIQNAYGIFSYGNSNITIKNCNISGFYTANLFFQNINQSRIDNLTTCCGNTDGVYIDQSYYNNFTNITSYNNSVAQFMLYRSYYNFLERINVYGSRAVSVLAGGLTVYTSQYNNLTSINSSLNSLNGVLFYSTARYNNLINSTISSNNGSGIRVESSRNNLVVNSTIENSTLYGVYMVSSYTNSIYNNLFNNSVNFYSSSNSSAYANTLNTTKKLGLNIHNQSNPYIGGNLWAAPNGTGFSETCPDLLRDGFCDNVKFIDTGSSWINDSLPLSNKFRNNLTAPIVNLVYPLNKGDTDGNITFIYNVSAVLDIMNCSLIFENTLNQTNSTPIFVDTSENFTLSNLDIGKYSWRINCTDYGNNRSTSSIGYFAIIGASSFSGNTTDLTQVEDISNITNFVIEEPTYGRINFTESVNLSDGADLDAIINISSNRIEINSTAFPGLNKSARLSLYSLTYTNPRVLKDGTLCLDCTEISYSGGTLIFDVNSFSVYSTEESPVVDSVETDDSSNLSGSSTAYNLENKNYSLMLRKGLNVVFYLGGSLHSMRVIEINETLKLNISNVVISLGINETKKLNLTSKDYYNFEIHLKEIKNSLAYVSINKINEEIVTEELPSGENVEPSNFTTGVNNFTDYFKEISDEEILAFAIAIFVLFLILWRVAHKKIHPPVKKKKKR